MGSEKREFFLLEPSARVNSSTMTEALLFIVSSPSGGGKTTVIKSAMARLQDRGFPSHFSISHTTRPPRATEENGVDYHFVDNRVFERMIADGKFLEYAEYAGFLYGTSRQEVLGHMERGVDVFLDIEVQGANQVKTAISEVVKVFLYPPSYEELKGRLIHRGQNSPEAIRHRLIWAEREFSVAGEFDYAIINDRLDEAVETLVGICLSEHHRSDRMKPVLDRIRQDFLLRLKEDVT